MEIDEKTLIAIGLSPENASNFAYPLNAVCKSFDINTPQRVAPFLANCCWESKNFSVMSEDLHYTDPARIARIFHTSIADAQRVVGNPQATANLVYAGRNGNGDEKSGDGWRYRGRGPIELSGKRNYMYAGAALGFDYVEDPDLVMLPSHGSYVAGWFWMCGNLNRLADAGDLDGITRAVNGPAMLGNAERKALAASILNVLTA